MLSNTEFKDQSAIVTGGSSGIGLQIAKELAYKGAGVTIFGRDPEKLDSAVEHLSELGLSVGSHAVDVRNSLDVKNAVNLVSEKQRPISLLVNNAAGNFRVDPLLLSDNGWDAVVKTVLYGTWNVTRALAQAAIENGQSLSVVNIGTSAAAQGSPSTVHSASAKAGVASMTRSLASAWADKGVRVNLLIPGLTRDTGGSAILFAEPERLAEQLDRIPLGRLAETQEIAHACSFLLSRYASYITGAELVIDGGRQLGRF